jgi:hypothetical protein
MHYINSIAALQELLFSGPPPLDAKEEENSKKNVQCHITKKSENISYMRNGIEYCSVEVTCDNGSQYTIQAYGDEAMDLYKELKKSMLVEERIDGTTYTFDNNGCALIFKKLRSVMGEGG